MDGIVEVKKPAIRKRRRPEWSHNDNADDQDAPDAAPECLQTPHTLRLLKLIEEGTLDHARMAASHLAALESSPVVLWDLLGRLQALLLSPEWSTRRHASLAMQGVAQHIPTSDQEDFLQAIYTGPLWLTVEHVSQGLDTVLKEGRVLLAASETNDTFDTHKDRLKRLDESRDELQQDFVEQRVRLQREILAERLGLAGVVRAVGGTVLDDVITKEDLLMNDTDDTNKQQAQQIARRDQSEDDDGGSIRALLVMEMRQQQQDETRGATSHKNPQTLLATELIYRTFDPSWHVRHGALLGTLALLRAWKGQRHFGVWPQDILARCLCVLSLDRFGDYGGAGEDESDVVVAPVREMAGQLLSVLWTMAPSHVQNECLSVLVRMSTRDEWEVRHGALLAMKYIVVMVTSDAMKGTKDLLFDGAIHRVMQVAQAGLSDKMEDVQSVAAQILLHILNESSEKQRSELIQASCQPLFDAFGRVHSVSSCAVDFVALFAAMICSDCTLVCKTLASEVDHETPIMCQIVEKLLIFIDFDSLAVKFSALKAIGSIAVPYAAIMSQISDGSDLDALVASYCGLLERVFGSLVTNNGAQNEEDKASRLSRVHDAVWSKLVDSAVLVLANSPLRRNETLVRLVLCYSRIWNEESDRRARVPNAISARALAYLLAELDNGEDVGRRDDLSLFLEATSSLLLCSPWTEHFDSGCILYQSICSSTSRCTDFCRDLLHRLLLGLPQSVEAENAGLSTGPLSNPVVIEACEQSFGCALKCVLDRGKLEGDFDQVWSKALLPYGLSLPVHESAPATMTTASMQAHAMVAGAIVSGGEANLPSKLTPLIRALMTSLKSERQIERLNLTSDNLALLLRALSKGDNELHMRVKTKILENVCVMLASEPASSDAPGCDISQSGAARVIALFVSQLPSGETLEAISPIWSRLCVLVESDASQTSEESLAESLSMLRVVCKSLERGTAVGRHVIENLMRPLALVACCFASSCTRTIATHLTVSLCKTEPDLALDTVLPFMLECLEDTDQDARRLGSLRLLHSIIEEVGTDICPFVRCLLPVTMSLMTDTLEDCAKQAAQSFAVLVRVSPLVKESSRRPWEREATNDHSEKVIDHLIHGKPLPPCVLPAPIAEDLDASGVQLRSYQMEGIAWLRFLQQVKLSGALCDDMGVGKTLQALVAVALSHLHARSEDASARPVSLVVCPSTLVGHWLAELRKFFRLQKVLRGASLGGALKISLGDCGEHNIVVISYSTLRREVSVLSKKQWDYCILDEGHLLKNPKTATARSARRIRARHKLILTGTPVQNRVHELWAAFDFLMPNFLGSQTWFSKQFARPIGKGQLPGASAESIHAGMEKLKLLHQQVLPFILRREKEQVLKELPPKCITDIPCELSSEQQDLYETFCRDSEAKKAISALQKCVTESAGGSKVEDGEGTSNLGSDALRSLLYLRLLCTHPSLVTASRQSKKANGVKKRIGISSDDSYSHLDSSGKLKALNELLRSARICGEELTAADNDASVFYCDFDDKDSGDELSAVLGTGGDTGDSFSAPTDQADTAKGSKCLIFAQFTQSLDVVEKYLFQPHMPSLRYVRLDGTVPPERRGAIADAFNRDDSIKVMLLTTRVGGLGLNLTGADTVIFLEHDYNPHADLQAMDRTHRLGQTVAVNVYRLVTQNTIEEKIMKLQETKMAISKAIVNSENSSMYSMGTDRLLDIFTFRSDTQKKTADDKKPNLELEGLDDMYSADDYASLSVQEFIKGFQSTESTD